MLGLVAYYSKTFPNSHVLYPKSHLFSLTDFSLCKKSILTYYPPVNVKANTAYYSVEVSEVDSPDMPSFLIKTKRIPNSHSSDKLSIESTTIYKSNSNRTNYDESCGTFRESERLYRNSKKTYNKSARSRFKSGNLRPSSYNGTKNKLNSNSIRGDMPVGNREIEKTDLKKYENQIDILEPPEFILSVDSVIKKSRKDPKHENDILKKLKPATFPGKSQENTEQDLERLKKIEELTDLDKTLTCCWGCGVAFQSEDPKKIGHISKTVIEKYKIQLEEYEKSLNSTATFSARKDSLTKDSTENYCDRKDIIQPLDGGLEDFESLIGLEDSFKRASSSSTTKRPVNEKEFENENFLENNNNPDTKISAENIDLDHSNPEKNVIDSENHNNGDILEKKKSIKSDNDDDSCLGSKKNKSLIPPKNRTSKIIEELGIDEDLLKFEREMLNLDSESDLSELIPSSVRSMNNKSSYMNIDEEILKMDLKNHIKSIIKPTRIVCERCWTLKYQSKTLPLHVTPEYYTQVISPLKNQQGKVLIVKIVDIFDFHGSFIPQIRKYVGNSDIMIVATKCDLLPQGAHLPRIITWIHAECKRFKIDPVHVALISRKSEIGITELANSIEFYRKGRDVYVVGSANAGKSTFINYLIDKFKGPKDKKTTVSVFPGTTLNMISLPIGKTSFMYDTPGIIVDRQIYSYLNPEELKLVLPKKKVRPSVYRLEPGKTLFLGGLTRFDYLKGRGLVYFTVFASPNILVHKTSTEKADELYKNQLGTLLTPPSDPETLKNWQGLIPHPIFTIENEDGNWQKACSDIVFGGVGWISITQKGTIDVQAWAHPGCIVGERNPLMPFESKLGALPNPRFNRKPNSVPISKKSK